MQNNKKSESANLSAQDCGNSNLEYIKYFKDTYSTSISITHKEYLEERCSKRKLFIYGTDIEAVDFSKYLALSNIYTFCFIDDEKSGNILEGKKVISSIDLVYENPNDVFIIIVKGEEFYGSSREKFLAMGLVEDIDFTYHAEVPATKEAKCYDVTLSYNRVVDKIEGFEIYGDIDNSNAIKIVLLGGSTTESSYLFIKGWAQFLSQILYKNNQPAIIYCGGVAGYSSSQELLKLIRDVLPLKPDVILSYSGLNDLYGYPKANEVIRHRRPFITHFQVEFIEHILEELSTIKTGLPVMHDLMWDRKGENAVYYGLENDKTAAELWLDNTRIMHSTAMEFNIDFVSIFQPFAFNEFYEIDDLQKIIFSRKSLSCLNDGYAKWGKPFRADILKIRTEIENYDYILDFSDIFSAHKGIYFDACHVYEKGNQLIASKIYEVLVPYLKND